MAILIDTFLFLGMGLILTYYISVFVRTARRPKEDGFRLGNTFAYEMDSFLSKGLKFFVKGLPVVGGLLLGSGLFLLLQQLGGVYFTITGALFAVGIVSFMVGVILPFDYYRSHILLVMAGMVSLSLSGLLVGLSHIIGQSAVVRAGSLSVAISIIVGLLGLVGLGLVWNPKLFCWSRLERNADGRLIRPSINWLAFYEWLYPALMLVMTVLLLVNSFINPLSK